MKIPLTVAFNQAVTTNKELFGDKFDTNLISDGYHTFGELYEHRIALFIALCRFNAHYCFRTPEKDGWFILGINTDRSKQITYHLPASKLSEVEFAEVLQDYKFDGHTSADVLERLKSL
jgi:hypothetical protein